MIVLDIDGVVADFYSELVYVMKNNGVEISHWSEWGDYHFSNIIKDYDHTLVQSIIDNPIVAKNCKPFEEAWYWTNFYGERYDIMYLTSRNESLNNTTWNWFYEWDMPADFVVFERNKVEFLRNLQIDVYIDDHPEVVSLARDSGIEAYLINRPYNSEYLIDNDFRINSLWEVTLP